MIRTYHIGKVEARYTSLGNNQGAHVFSYHELEKLMKKVERVRETNTSVVLVRGHSAIHATVRGTETPQELKARLRDRRRHLRMNLKIAVEALTRGDRNRLDAIQKIAEIEPLLKPLLRRKPAAKKRKPK